MYKRQRALCGDRAVLRAHHFFTEDARVSRQCDALEAGDLPLFLELVRQSGLSSYMYLQNVSTYRDSRCQPMALLLALAIALGMLFPTSLFYLTRRVRETRAPHKKEKRTI